VLKWLFFTYKASFKLPIRNLEQPNVIIVSSPSLFPILAGYKWSRKFRAKLIFEVRDIWPLTLVELGGYSSNHPFIKMMEWFEKFAYKKADKVISVLPLAYKHMEKQGLDLKKFVYIPNGICINELREIEPLPEDIKSRIPRNKFIVAYTGTFGKANALEYLIKAASLLKNYQKIHFLLVGKGVKKKT
jgi:glycosyltransferase involved in cell wall biosynthesis